MTSSARPLRAPAAWPAARELEPLVWPVLAVLVLASSALVYHLSRGSSLSPDDWVWVDTRRGDGLSTFLAPYNGHLSVVPLVIYRVMFALVGIGDFAWYRLMLAIVAGLSGIVVFLYARSRVGAGGALVVTALLLFLGPGWNDLLQPFQIAWLIAVAAAIGALSRLDRTGRSSGGVACLLLLVAIASTSVGVALTIAAGIELVLRRRLRRDGWVVGVPLVLYVVWAVHYHPDEAKLSALLRAPAFIVQTTGAGISGALGLSNVSALDLTGTSLVFGASLLALAVLAVARRPRDAWDRPRVVALGCGLVIFSVLTTVVRAFQSPFSSRYIYVTCVLVALIGVELVRGMRVSAPVGLAVGLATIAAVVANVGVLRTGGTYLRLLGAQSDATLGALQLDRGRVSPDTPIADRQLAVLGHLTAGRYFADARALGTPADSLAELRGATADSQSAADAQLIADRDVTVSAAAPRARGGAPGAVAGGLRITGSQQGRAAYAGGCARFEPSGALPPGGDPGLTLTEGPGRIAISAGRAPVTVGVRRFAPTSTPLTTLAPHRTAILSVRADAAPDPWRLELTSTAELRACTT